MVSPTESASLNIKSKEMYYVNLLWIWISFNFLLPIHSAPTFSLVDDFDRPDSLYHGDDWETLNPGYWQIKDRALRRRLKNVGNRNPITSFPWHWSNGGKEIEPRAGNRRPNLPMGIIWRRDWQVRGNYTVRATFTIRQLNPPDRGESSGYLGICFGGQSLYESRGWNGAEPGDGSWMVLWQKDGLINVYEHAKTNRPIGDHLSSPIQLTENDQLQIELQVTGTDAHTANVTARWIYQPSGDSPRVQTISISDVDRQKYTEGYFGLAGYGALDFEMNRIEIWPGENMVQPTYLNQLHVCYPLGDSLQQVDGEWRCKFVSLFRNGGSSVEIRIADTPTPVDGWAKVAVAGQAPIVNNTWRRYTAIVDVTLPVSPAEKTLFYTVWKDGEDVTIDPRPADQAKGYLGPKSYTGRLPQLKAPYRVCTLGGHALHGGGTTLPSAKTYQKNWIHGQPTENAYRYFEDYNFQIINWDDDVWYLELLFPPPSTDDAYKIINLTIGNPTTRWKMMRHWNVINPGDHDYGMDDIKGPEQILVRQLDDLGQDTEYMRRNYAINHHLVEGKETEIEDQNPKDWRRWKMPNGDFTLIVLESRLWRTSQDTNIWVKGG